MNHRSKCKTSGKWKVVFVSRYRLKYPISLVLESSALLSLRRMLKNYTGGCMAGAILPEASLSMLGMLQ